MRPNVLVVFLDDHASWALGCYGNSEVQTPTLDYLAATGVRMENSFTPTPVCSPGRAAFLTGRLSSQHGVHDYLNVWDPEVDRRNWIADELTLPEILRDHGYTTGLAGKWHLGRSFERAPGFDFWYELADEHANKEHLDSPWEHSPAFRGGYNRHAVTERAIDFLRARDEEKPFFLHVGYVSTHSPWEGRPERYVSRYRRCDFDDIPDDATYPFGRMASESLMPSRRDRRETLAQYYASATEVDEQVGRLVDELETQGLRENTLVVYTSDHGLNMGHHGIWGKGNGTKPYNMVEESIRVPLILNQPGALLGDQSRSEMVTHCDLFRTILDHTGVALPAETLAERNYPGRSFASLLGGGHVAGWPEEVYGEYGNLRMIRTRTHKLTLRPPDGPAELIDLVADPRETVNLYADPRHADLVADLTGRVERYFGRYEDPVNSGLRVAELPQHNMEEVWRFPDTDSIWWE
ncbi:sulfatase-like hydrolase/transferase [Streptosporangium amethystogenes]|uniref:sulfatase-like hydrolase/transferase n=1 Tax=Streptosporangium amethystogenes TaxID=2002 RepID=UPI0006909B66|nr:sulfatase-like hydrolase/transferase [Streptosporangium amethystogenes]